jgi:hypothetical protein
MVKTLKRAKWYIASLRMVPGHLNIFMTYDFKPREEEEEAQRRRRRRFSS